MMNIEKLMNEIEGLKENIKINIHELTYIAMTGENKETANAVANAACTAARELFIAEYRMQFDIYRTPKTKMAKYIKGLNLGQDLRSEENCMAIEHQVDAVLKEFDVAKTDENDYKAILRLIARAHNLI